jgi:hypothetical protein
MVMKILKVVEPETVTIVNAEAGDTGGQITPAKVRKV